MLAASAPVLASPGAERSSERLYELAGQIVREETGRPRHAGPALVTLSGSTIPFAARTEADRAGEFRFRGLRAGTYTLVIAAALGGTLTQTVEVGPSVADSKGRVSAAFRLERRLAEGDAHLVAASQLAIPERAMQAYEKAQQQLGRHDVTGAVASLERALAIAPHYSAAWNNLGTIAYQTGDYVRAERCFRTAREHDPESYAPLVNLGGTLLSQGRAAESLAVNQRAVKAHPDDALAHAQLGQSYLRLGDLDQAVQHLKRAKEIDPAHFSLPQVLLGEIYARRGDPAAAIAEFEEFLQRHPDSGLGDKVRSNIEALRRAQPNR
jgi:tetratricopeptide (TPR) repeat protein